VDEAGDSDVELKHTIKILDVLQLFATLQLVNEYTAPIVRVTDDTKTACSDLYHTDLSLTSCARAGV
jgi:hypothetical protein